MFIQERSTGHWFFNLNLSWFSFVQWTVSIFCSCCCCCCCLPSLFSLILIPYIVYIVLFLPKSFTKLSGVELKARSMRHSVRIFYLNHSLSLVEWSSRLEVWGTQWESKLLNLTITPHLLLLIKELFVNTELKWTLSLFVIYINNININNIINIHYLFLLSFLFFCDLFLFLFLCFYCFFFFFVFMHATCKN